MADSLRRTGTFPLAISASARPRPDWLTRLPTAVLAGTGGLLIIVGASLPWLTLFAGLQSLKGTDGFYGRLLVAGGIAAILSGAAFVITGSRLTRWLIGLLGFALTALSGWMLIGLLETWREVSADPFLVGALGRGLFVSSIGAVMVSASLLVTRGFDLRSGVPTATARVAIAATTITAALVHFAMVGSHLEEQWLVGGIFALTGILQLIWALSVLLRQLRPALLLAGIAGNLLIIGTWIVSRTTSVLTALDAHEEMDMGTLGAVASCAEGVAIVLGVSVLLHNRRNARRIG